MKESGPDKIIRLSEFTKESDNEIMLRYRERVRDIVNLQRMLIRDAEGSHSTEEKQAILTHVERLRTSIRKVEAESNAIIESDTFDADRIRDLTVEIGNAINDVNRERVLDQSSQSSVEYVTSERVTSMYEELATVVRSVEQLISSSAFESNTTAQGTLHTARELLGPAMVCMSALHRYNIENVLELDSSTSSSIEEHLINAQALKGHLHKVLADLQNYDQ